MIFYVMLLIILMTGNIVYVTLDIFLKWITWSYLILRGTFDISSLTVGRHSVSSLANVNLTSMYSAYAVLSSV